MFFGFMPFTSSSPMPCGIQLRRVGAVCQNASIPQALCCTLYPQFIAMRSPVCPESANKVSSKQTNVCESGKTQTPYELHSRTNNHRTLLLTACLRDAVCAFPTPLTIKNKQSMLPLSNVKTPFRNRFCTYMGTKEQSVI